MFLTNKSPIVYFKWNDCLVKSRNVKVLFPCLMDTSLKWLNSIRYIKVTGSQIDTGEILCLTLNFLSGSFPSCHWCNTSSSKYNDFTEDMEKCLLSLWLSLNTVHVHFHYYKVLYLRQKLFYKFLSQQHVF